MIALLAAAFADDLLVPVTVCVEYDIQFIDSVYSGGAPPVGPGDYWLNNDVNRPAKWLYAELHDDYQTHAVQLNRDGCVTTTLEFEARPDDNYPVWLRLAGKARRKGIAFELRHDFRNFLDEEDPPIWDEAYPRVQDLYFGVSGSGGTYTTSFPPTNGWQARAVAVMMIDRNAFRLAYPTNNQCCEPDEANAWGTCVDPTKRYDRSFEPYLESAPLIAISTHGGGNCCGSKIRWTAEEVDPLIPDDQETWRSGLHIPLGGGGQRRFWIAHELGHMFAGIRMGDFERNMYAGDAPVDGCMGDMNTSGDVGDPTVRGVFQKDYMSVALREGYADWIAMWAWNVPGNACEMFAGRGSHDFDLDGDRDNYDPSWVYSSYSSCHGPPSWTMIRRGIRQGPG